MRIPYIHIPAGDDAAVFATLPVHRIDCCNWPDEYPARPEVTFKIFHDGMALHIRFDVDEHGTIAATTADNGPVWCDSCVEFFIAPDHGGYYNFELNCIGALLIGYRDGSGDAVQADTATLVSVGRRMSLPRRAFGEHRVGRWSATVVIPATALFKHGLRSWRGLEARVNLYKCGDNLSEPHFLSWRPIDWPTPNFHLPQFFGDAVFE